MKYNKYLPLLTLILLSNPLFAQKSKKISKVKQVVINSVATHRQELIGLSDKIWALAETALMEFV